MRAVIFDFNGVIVDDEALHAYALCAVLAEEGVALDEAGYFAHFLGLSDRACFERALLAADQPFGDARVAGLVARKSAVYDDLVADGVLLVPGAADLVRACARRVPVAICSGALRPEIEAVLTQHELRQSVSVIVSAEDVTRGKPDPEGYRLALTRLRALRPDLADLRPGDVVALEDAPRGVDAARAAGLRVVALAGSAPSVALVAADQVWESLEGALVAALLDD